MLLFAALSSFFVAAVLANLNGLAGFNGRADTPMIEDVTLELDADWYLFPFTNVGVPVPINFIVNTPFTPLTIIQLTDLYCIGDRFVLSSTGGPLFVPLPTTVVTPDLECTISTNNATLAYLSTLWSHAGATLAVPGAQYNFTVTPLVSPFSAGVAAIRFATFAP